MKRIAIALVVIAVVLAGLWSYLTAREDFPETSTYRIDLDALKALAESEGGTLPTAVHHELVALVGLPKGMVFAGEPMDEHPMVHGAYLVEYAEGGGVMIDAAFGEADMAGFLFEGRFDARAFEKVRSTMLEVDHIVLTHEHFDHIGGLAYAPDAQAVSERLVMNPEQLASSEAEQYLPDELRSKLEPVDYEETMLLAPGVVLLRAPGHTPGSQIVYVLLASGEEMLFIGDVAWALDQIRNEHYRPRLVTDIFLGEDREGVMHQMLALKGVMAGGRATVVSSHDVEDRRRLIEAGVIGEGFP